MNDHSNPTTGGRRVVEPGRLPIELCKLLKLEGLVASGGEAKQAITAGRVVVNGAVETRKRKQIRAGDCIQFSGLSIEVAAGEGPGPAP